MKKQIKIAFGVLAAASVLIFYSFKLNDAAFLSEVHTEGGLVSGMSNSDGTVVTFKGVPFAAPPVGDLRWKTPQPTVHWDGVKKCDAFSASPMQPKPVPFMVYTSEFLIPEQPISEDCLYLNIWTNAKTKADKKPVFVWIYGGGFSSGGSACPIYDGEAMAKKGVLFVSINYRVGVFGFMAHPELTKESPDKASGNYGLLDQVAALKWIKKNIEAFGGDPDNITIAGQSAGSMSVNCLVASPLTKGLFNRAIAESGSFLIKNARSNNSLQAAEAQGQTLAERAGAKSLAELRAMPAEEVLKKIRGEFGVIVDGYVLPETVSDIFATNRQNHVPLLTGWNKDESFVMTFKKKEDFKEQAEKTYGADAEKFLKNFPAETDEQAARSQVEVSRNEIFALSGYKWAGIQSKYDNSPVYVYNFNRKVPATGDMAKFGAFHTGEVCYVMDNLKFLNNRPFTPGDDALAKLMSAYWVNFIRTGDPNGTGLPVWPKYDTGKQQVKVFDLKTVNETVPGKGGLDFMLSRSGN